MRRDIFVVGALWIALTVLGELLVWKWEAFPLGNAVEGKIIDDAFWFMTVLAIPIFTFVVAVLLYGIPRFRRAGVPTEDGPAYRTNNPLVAFWLIFTTLLCLLVIITPGITGLAELKAHADEKVDVVVEVQGNRWYWEVSYPQYGVVKARDELVLPVGEHARFDITASDVLHSFWIPSFRIKIDAVPGMTTHTNATPQRVSDTDDDISLRLQCAELCGTGHALMHMDVRVVTREEFDAWVAKKVREQQEAVK